MAGILSTPHAELALSEEELQQLQFEEGEQNVPTTPSCAVRVTQPSLAALKAVHSGSEVQ
jgi:hypothetical protein